MKTVCVIDGNFKERREFLNIVKNSLVDYEYFEITAEDTYDYVAQLITEISCFGQRRLYVIKELPKLKTSSKESDASKDRTKILNNFKKMIQDIPNGNVVVFDNINISSSGFLEEVRKHGRVEKFPEKIAKNKARSDIVKYFDKVGISLEEGASALMADSLNFIGDDVNVDKLELLLLKMYSYVSHKNNIVMKDVYSICSSSREFVIWNLYSILDDNNNKQRYQESLKIVMNFLSESEHPDFEATFLMQGMLWRFGLVLIIKSRLNKIKSEELVNEISKIIKLKASGLSQKIIMSGQENKPEYSVGMIGSIINKRYGKDVVSCYTFEELLSIYKIISKSLTKIRSGCSSSEIITILQIILLIICKELPASDLIMDILEHKKSFREIN